MPKTKRDPKRDRRRVASLARLAADQAATPAEKRAARGRAAAITKRAAKPVKAKRTTKPKTTISEDSKATS